MSRPRDVEETMLEESLEEYKKQLEEEGRGRMDQTAPHRLRPGDSTTITGTNTVVSNFGATQYPGLPDGTNVVKPINAFKDILERNGERLILLGILEELTNIRKILAKAKRKKK